MVKIFTCRTLDWARLWASTNLSSTDSSGRPAAIFITNIEISVTEIGASVNIGISLNRGGTLHSNDHAAIQKRLGLLLAKHSDLNLQIRYFQGGSVTLTLDPSTAIKSRLEYFCDMALKIAESIWEIFGLEKYFLKKLSYSSSEVLRDDETNTAVEPAEWLKENHPLLKQVSD